MRNSAIFIVVLFAIYILSWLYDICGKMIFLTDIKISKYDFLSRAHSTIYMGVAALIIVIQHIGGSFGTRIFTPLGGTGVAMFLIASGYGLNESYKNQKQKLLNSRQWGATGNIGYSVFFSHTLCLK